MIKDLKHSFFRTCPKTGRIVGIKYKNFWLRLFFPITCIAVVIWFLVRVIPKPSRIYYPCQQIIAPLALSILTYAASALGVIFFFRKMRSNLSRNKLFISFFLCLFFILSVGIFVANNSFDSFGSFLNPKLKEYIPTDGPNQPMGEGKGIFPGRVAWVRDSTVSKWKGEFGEGKWWDDKFTLQDTVSTMIRKSLFALTGTTSRQEAWDKIFVYHNTVFNHSQSGYQKGEKIAIKINCNNAYEGYTDNDNQIDASKQTVLALIRELVNFAGVDPKDILIYEAIRVIPDRIYLPCHKEFPEVRWMDSKGNTENGRLPVVWKSDVIHYSQVTECGTGIPLAVYESKYLINLFLVKGHVTNGLSLGAKNHYGTIDGRDHTRKLPKMYHPYVDFMGSNELGGKTILYIADGLYGLRDVNDPVTKEFAQWNNTFNGQWLSSIFMSLDPIAIDSVCYDFLRAEFGARLGRGTGAPADTYMHEAALADNPPSGVLYKPNGVRLNSLGVHEHWNNPRERKYTRNLNPKSNKGIELFEVN